MYNNQDTQDQVQGNVPNDNTEQDNSPVKKLYDVISSPQAGRLYTKSYDDFKNQFNNTSSVDKLYNILSSDQAGKLYTKSKGDFYNQFFSDVVPSDKPVISMAFDAKKAKDDYALQNQYTKDLKQAQPFGYTYNQPNMDESRVKQADETQKELQQYGIDVNKITQQIPQDFPHNIYSPQQQADLLKLSKTNPQQFERTVNAASWQMPLITAIHEKEPNKPLQQIENEVIGLQGQQGLGDYDSKRSQVQATMNLINQYVDDPELKKRMAAYVQRDAQFNYGLPHNAIQNSPLKQYGLDNNAIIGLNLLQDTDPEKAKTFENVLVKPDNLDKVDVINNNGKNVTYTVDRGEKLGWQQQAYKLAQIGANVRINTAQEIINKYKSKGLDNLTPDEKTDYNNAVANYNSATSDLKEMDNPNNPTYGLIAQRNLNNIAQEIVGQKHGYFSNQGLKTLGNEGNLISGITNTLSDFFSDDEEKKRRALGIIGQGIKSGNEAYTTQKNSLFNNFDIEGTPEFDKQKEAILKDNNLSYDQKISKVSDLLQQQRGRGWNLVSKDPTINNSGSAWMYALGDAAGQLGLFMLNQAALGGFNDISKAKQVATLGVTTFLQDYGKNVQNNLTNNVPAPQATSFLQSVSNAAAMMAGDKLGYIKSAFNPESVAGNVIADMSENEVLNLAKRGEGGIIKATAQQLLQGAKHAIPMVAATTAGQIANDKMMGDDKPITDYVKEAATQLPLFSVLSLMGVPAKYEDNNMMPKYALHEMALHPEKYLQALDEAKTTGAIKLDQANMLEGKINSAANVLSKIQFIDNNEQPLTDSQKANLLWNKTEILQLEDKLKTDIPDAVRKKTEDRIEVLKTKNNKIYEGFDVSRENDINNQEQTNTDNNATEKSSEQQQGTIPNVEKAKKELNDLINKGKDLYDSDGKRVRNGVELTTEENNKINELERFISDNENKQNIDYDKGTATFEIGGKTIEVQIPKDIVDAASEMDEQQKAKAEQILRDKANDEFNRLQKESEIAQSNETDNNATEKSSEQQQGTTPNVEDWSKDVESTANKLKETEQKQPSLWGKIKDVFNKGINKVFGGSLKMSDSEKLSSEKIKNRIDLIAQKLGVTIEYKPHPKGAAFQIGNDGKFYITIDPKLFEKGFNGQEAFDTINVIAHELGHAIDAKEVFKNNLSEQEISELAKLHRAFINTFNFDVGEDISGLQESIKNNNKNITGEGEDIEKLRNPKTHAHRHEQEELFADALRMMVISPKLAKRIAPNLFERLSKYGLGDNEHQSISEAYHKAKSDGSNPELVKAVEDLLGKPTEKPKETTDNSNSGISSEKGQDVTPEKTFGESLLTKEPEQKDGTTIVTNSGLTEPQRQKLIETRQSQHQLNEKQVKENAIMDLLDQYKKLRNGRLGKEAPEGLELQRKLNIAANELGYRFDKKSEAIRKGESNRSAKLESNTKEDSDLAIHPEGKTLYDRSPQVQEAFNHALENGSYIDVKDSSGKSLSAAQVDKAIQDINDGIPSVRATNYLDEFEKGLHSDLMPVKSPFGEDVALPFHQFINAEKEQVGEPIDEKELFDWLNKDSELHPEDTQEVLDNFENLITEYEQQLSTENTEPSGEIQQPAPAGEGSDNATNEQDSSNQSVPQTEKPISSDEGASTTEGADTRTDEPNVSDAEGNGEPPTAGEEKSDVEDGKTTSVKNEVKLNERIKRGLDEVTSHDTKTDEERYNETINRIENGEINPAEISSKLSDNPKATLLDKDGNRIPDYQVQYALAYDSMDISTRYDDVIEALKNPDVINDEGRQLELLAKKKILEEALDKNEKASRYSGTELSSAFRARQKVIDNMYNLVNVIGRYKAANKGAEVPKHIEAQLSDLTKSLKEQGDKLSNIQRELSEIQKQKDEAQLKIQELNEALEIERNKAVANKKGNTEQRRAQLKKEKQDVIALLKAKWKEKGKNDTLTAVPIPFAKEIAKKLVKVAPVLTKLVKIYIEEGALTVEDIISRLRADLPEYKDATDAQLRDAITGYGKVRLPNKDSIEKIYRDLKAQMRLLSAIEDAKDPEQNYSPKKTGYQREEPSPIVKSLQEELDDIMKENAKRVKEGKSDEEVYRSKIQAYKKRVQNLIDKADAVLKGDKPLDQYLEERKRKSIQLNEEALQTKAEYESKKAAIDRIIRKRERENRDSLQKLTDFIVDLKREAVVFNLSSILKLGTTGVTTLLRKAPEDIIAGSLLDKMLPDAITSKAFAEAGGLALNAESTQKAFAKYGATWKDLFTNFNKSEQGSILKTGNDSLDYAHNPNKNYNELFTLYAGRLHGLLKEPTKQASYVSYMNKMAANMQKAGVDISLPEVQRQMADYAYLLSKKDILTNPNIASKYYRMGLSWLDKQSNFGARFASAAAKIEMPIVTVPTNFFNEILKYEYGALHATGKLLQVEGKGAKEFINSGQFSKVKAEEGLVNATAELLKAGLKNIDPKDADYIVRCLKKQFVGGAIYALGYAMAGSIGGYNDKENKKKGLKEGQAKIFGATLPKILFHNPLFEPLLMGATIHDDIKEGKGFSSGALKSVIGAVNQTPFISSLQDLYKIKDDKNANTGQKIREHLGGLVGSEIPGIIGEVAKWTDNGDVTRVPQGFWDEVFLKVPGLRQQVKSKVEIIMEKRLHPNRKTLDQKVEAREEKNIDEENLKTAAKAVGIKYIPPRR